MILTEYDAEKHMRDEKLLSYDKGRRDGEEIGADKVLLRLIVAKVHKNLSCEEIADILEMDVDAVLPIYNIVKSNPEADENKIYEILRGSGLVK